MARVTTDPAHAPAGPRTQAARIAHVVLWVVAVCGLVAGLVLIDMARPEQIGFMDRAMRISRRTRWDLEAARTASTVIAGSLLCMVGAIISRIVADASRNDPVRDAIVIGLLAIGAVAAFLL